MPIAILAREYLGEGELAANIIDPLLSLNGVIPIRNTISGDITLNAGKVNGYIGKPVTFEVSLTLPVDIAIKQEKNEIAIELLNDSDFRLEAEFVLIECLSHLQLPISVIVSSTNFVNKATGAVYFDLELVKSIENFIQAECYLLINMNTITESMSIFYIDNVFIDFSLNSNLQIDLVPENIITGVL